MSRIIRYSGLTQLALDDYKLREYGEFELVAKTEDKTDRVLKTDSKGNVKTDRKGNAKVAIDGIEKGILKDGLNLQENNNVIAVGGEGQATIAGFEDFALKLSNYVDKEMGGYYLSDKGKDNINKIYVGAYKNNTATRASAALNLKGTGLSFENIDVHVDYHTHLSRFADEDRGNPSGARGEGGGDMEKKGNVLKNYPYLKFRIITNPTPFDY